MTDKTLITDDDLRNLRAVEDKGLFKGEDGYTAYWTDGDRMITHKTYTTDKHIAEQELKNLLLKYWIEKDAGTKMNAIIRAIRTASKIELAEINSHVEDEMELRGMKRRDMGWRLKRRKVMRVKDYLWSYYDRKDYDEQGNQA